MRIFRWMLSVVGLVAQLGCTTRYQVRGVEGDLGRELDIHRVETVLEEQVNLDARSVELYDDVSLGIIELTDDGAFNPRQKNQVMDMVRRDASKGALIVIFAHGWHHSPRVCDRDLSCFRRVLHALHNPAVFPKTIGIYLGWRGESISTPKLNVVTIWDRKKVAEHIGRTGAKEILIEIDSVTRTIKDEIGQQKITTVSVGHSLGGAMLFSAVRGKLIGNLHGLRHAGVHIDSAYRVARAAGDRAPVPGENEKALRARFGDLVILVNPAIEATAYSPLYNDLPDPKNRTLTIPQLLERRLPYDQTLPYSKEQLPILMVVASEADTAVGAIFPVSQVLLKLARPWLLTRPRTDYWGMGRYGPHITHRLTLDDSCAPPCTRRDENVDNCACSKSYPQSFGSSQLDFHSEQVQRFRGMRLERVREPWDKYTPYYVVQTDCHVISEHSDIFNEKLVTFLADFVASYTREKRDAPAHALAF